MSETLKQPFESQIVNPENFPHGRRVLEPGETVVIAGTSHDPTPVTFMVPRISKPDLNVLKETRYPIQFGKILRMRLGQIDSSNQDDYDEFEVLYSTEDDLWAIRSTKTDKSDALPTHIFTLHDGILGKISGPRRERVNPHVSYKHVRLNSVGDQITIENLQPSYQTALYSMQPPE